MSDQCQECLLPVGDLCPYGVCCDCPHTFCDPDLCWEREQDIMEWMMDEEKEAER